MPVKKSISDTVVAAKPISQQELNNKVMGDDEIDEGFEEFASEEDEQMDDDDEEEDVEVLEDIEDSDEMDADDDDEELDEDEDEDEGEDEGVALPEGRAISPSAIPFSSTASTTTTEAPTASLNPQKPTPYILDAGHLLVTDPNPLQLPQSTNPMAVEGALTATARDAAQTLLNHLLTTCPIHTAPTTSTSTSGITMSLPDPAFVLPREKKMPKPRAPTKWELFAARKGIGKDKRKAGTRAGELASTEGKMVYDEASGDWVPKWGYKGKNKRGEGDWLVEVDEKKEQREMEAGDPRKASRGERKERMKRNERAQRSNERKSRKNGA